MPGKSMWETIHQLNPILKEYDPFLESLYAQRAKWHQANLQKGNHLVIGDRSIVTSYVTRWNTWADPYYTIKRVEKFNASLMKPNLIIWLNVKPELAEVILKIESQRI